MEPTYLLPDLDDPIGGPFWEGCARGELLVQRFTAAATSCSRRARWIP